MPPALIPVDLIVAVSSRLRDFLPRPLEMAAVTHTAGLSFSPHNNLNLEMVEEDEKGELVTLE